MVRVISQRNARQFVSRVIALPSARVLGAMRPEPLVSAITVTTANAKRGSEGWGRCPRARYELPSAQLHPLRSLQQVPREGSHSACSPNLADGQGFRRNLKPEPNGEKSWETA